MNKRSYQITLDIIRLYTGSDLPEPLTNEVKSWLVSDFHMSEKAKVLWKIWDTLPALPDEKSERKAWKTIVRKTGLKQTGRSLSLKNTFVWSAAVVLPVCLVAGAYYLGLHQQHRQPEMVYVQQRTVITGAEKKHLVLSDGTEVWLNQGSEFTYGDDGQTQLTGEAFFKVSQQENRYFTVRTESMVLTVTGTRFNVQARPDEENSVVTLYEGALELATPDTLVMVKPGDEWTVSREMNVLSLEKTSRTAPAWNREYISYEDLELREIFRDLEKNYPVRIQGSRPDVMTDILTLKFEKDTDIDEIMFLLSQLNGNFNYTIENDTVHIY